MLSSGFWVALLLAIVCNVHCQTQLPATSHTMFPKGFLFGAATAAYQIEGGWNVDGKGLSIWDNMTHQHPDSIVQKMNGDVAADSYHLWKQDVQLLSDIGFQTYRFSISWPRILPTGRIDKINQAGIDYYMNLIDELKSKGIEPMVTIYHWDLPQDLEDIGGWLNPDIADLFASYADLVFSTYGSKVKWWITINEPLSIIGGYGDTGPAPSLGLEGTGDYAAGHNILRAHAKAYRLYEKKYKQYQGKLGIAFSGTLAYPSSDSPRDIAAAQRYMQFSYGWFAHPIYIGDYPPIMRSIVDSNSQEEGRNTSRLPSFTPQEIEDLKGAIDFFGVNYYTATMVEDGSPGPNPSRNYDQRVISSPDPSWQQAASDWLYNVPRGIRDLILMIKNEYGNPQIFVTENGWSDGDSNLNDINRIQYYEEHLAQLRKAIYDDGCNVIGHIAWSIIDNFEWNDGYSKKFGLVSVDFNSPARTRTWKKSAHWFNNYLNMHKLMQQRL